MLMPTTSTPNRPLASEGARIALSRRIRAAYGGYPSPQPSPTRGEGAGVASQRLPARLTLLSFAIALLLPLSAAAQGLPDPTRPPGVTSEAVGESNNSGLQTTVRPARGKPWALINGLVVTLGDKVGDARVVAINANSVVLQNPDGERQTLTATPGATKSPVKSDKTSHGAKP